MKKLAILAVAALLAVPSVGCHHCGDWFGGSWWNTNYCNDCCTTTGYGSGCNTCGTVGGDTVVPYLPTPTTSAGS